MQDDGGVVGPMRAGQVVDTQFVIGPRIWQVRVAPADRAKVTVRLAAGDDVWMSAEPAWRPLCSGAAPGPVGYLWSARRLIVLPAQAGVEPQLIDTDEDLLAVFAVPAGWLLVCETSVRRHGAGGELSRVELPDVVTSFELHGAILEVVDQAGTRHQIPAA
jgi:hypothetical protein